MFVLPHWDFFSRKEIKEARDKGRRKREKELGKEREERREIFDEHHLASSQHAFGRNPGKYPLFPACSSTPTHSGEGMAVVPMHGAEYVPSPKSNVWNIVVLCC